MHLKSLEDYGSTLVYKYLIKRVSIEFAMRIKKELSKEELDFILDVVSDDREYVFRLDSFQRLERKIDVSGIWDEALKACGYCPKTFNSDSEEDLNLFYGSCERVFDCKFDIVELTKGACWKGEINA